MGSTVLVTGGAGYIGSHTVRQLQNAGYSVVVIDHLEQGHRQALPHDIALYHTNIGEQDKIEQICRVHKVEAVLHFAAWIEVGRGEREPLGFYANNVSQTIRLLGAIQAAGVNKIIFSSTAAVFGETSEKPLAEDAQKAPASVYGRTKHIIETILQDIAATETLSYGILRYFNAAGADDAGDIGEDHHPETHLIPLILQVALEQRDSISIYGTDYPTRDGSCIRDYIHVNDLASAHLLALQCLFEGKSNFAYNLGSGDGHSVREVIACCRTVTGHPIPTVEAPRRDGDVATLLANSNRIQKELGWKPQYDLQRIVETAWLWHKQHPNGYDG